MGYSKIRPRRDIKANWERANPILLEGEIGFEFETSINIGQAKMKTGDGHTNWNALGYSITDDITDKAVKSIDSITVETPSFSTGEKLKTILGKIKKYLSDLLTKISTINTTIGQFKNVTINSISTSNITDAITKLDSGKLPKSSVYNGLDSSNTALALSASAGKQLKQMCDSNTNGINQLNSDLADGYPIDMAVKSAMPSGVMHLFGLDNNSCGLEQKIGNTIRRLQIDNSSHPLHMYESTDNGNTWMDITFDVSDGSANVNINNASNKDVQLRRCGRIVSLWILFRTGADYSGILGYIPDGYRPSFMHRALLSLDNGRVVRYCINGADGGIQLDGTVPGNTWAVISTMWIID